MKVRRSLTLESDHHPIPSHKRVIAEERWVASGRLVGPWGKPLAARCLSGGFRSIGVEGGDATHSDPGR